MIRYMKALRFPVASPFFSICRVILSDAFSILLPMPCRAFSSIILKSAYLSAKYPTHSNHIVVNVFGPH